MRRSLLIVVGICWGFATCVQAQSELREKLQANLWVQTSLEYEVACRQAFRLAELQLSESLKNPHRSAAPEQRKPFSHKPAAVVLDVDETVLDNSPFNARLTLEGTAFSPDRWTRWCEEEKAAAVPGAREFVQAARDRHVAVFFVTNREQAVQKATLRNLNAVLGGNVSADRLLMKKGRADWTSAKTNRRAHIAERFRIVMLVGDDVNDFVHLGKPTPAQRKSYADHFASSWGHHWVLLPNPVYGSWDKSLYRYNFDRTDTEKRQLLLEQLRTE